MPFISSVRGSFGAQSKSRRNFNQDMLSRITGGTVTTAGGYRIHTFTSTGTSTFNTSQWGSLNIEYLIIAGGGGGGNLGGGGGAGGMLSGSTSIAANSYSLTVGNGGSRSTQETGHSYEGTSGGNSTFIGLTAIGGGNGRRYNTASAAASGGSGGGGGAHQSGGGGGAGGVGENARLGSSINNNFGGAGTPGQGYDGGYAFQNDYPGSCTGGQRPGNGGPGLANSISGSSVTYAGGGGGGCYYTSSRAEGGSGGGGAGGVKDACGQTNGTDGTNGLGGGGGGSGHDRPGGYYSGGGGSGVVIVRYQI